MLRMSWLGTRCLFLVRRSSRRSFLRSVRIGGKKAGGERERSGF